MVALQGAIQQPSCYHFFMRKYLSAFLTLFWHITTAISTLTIQAQSLQAQEVQPPMSRTAVNTVYAEVLGSARLYSINYDRILGDVWAFRVGASFVPSSVNNGFGQYRFSDFTVPLTVSYLINLGNGAHNIEIGVGAAPTFGLASFEGKLSNGQTFESYTRGYTTTRCTAIAGYRFQPRDGGVTFRAVLTPSILFVPGVSPPLAPPEVLYGGISIGYTF